MRALRHGMAGQPGWELFGPWDEGEAVREATADLALPDEVQWMVDVDPLDML